MSGGSRQRPTSGRRGSHTFSIGLITVDVTPLGVVIAGDSQPVDMFAQHHVIYTQGKKTRAPIVRLYARDFTGFAAYVGTEKISGLATGDWLKNTLKSHYASPLTDICELLASTLTEAWTASDTHLSIFVTGYEGTEPRFWYISNGDVPHPATTAIPHTFEPVDNLGAAYANEQAESAETLEAFVARKQPSYRRGVMAAAAIFDKFTTLIGELMQDPEHPQVAPLDTLDRYAAYVKFRFEFTKRVYDPEYGIGIDRHRPVDGNIHVYSVDPSGVPRVHPKHVGQSSVLK